MNPATTQINGIKVQGALLLFLLLLSAAVFGCAESNADDGRSSAWEIPALKERSAGLDAGDFGLVKKQDASFRATLQTDPGNVKALVGLAQVFMYEARVTGDHPYYYPASEKLLDRALAINPNDYEAVVSKASVLLSLHQFAEALPVARRAVSLAPQAAAGYGAVVDACVELGQYEEAVKAADQMVAVRPDLKSYSRVSYLREIYGDREGAIEGMKLAVAAGAPGSEEKAWAQTTLGTLYLEDGKLDLAEREFRMAALERNRYPFALGGLARVMTARGKIDSAILLLESATTLMPEFSFVEQQAEIHRAAGNNRAADSLVAIVEKMLAEDEASGHHVDRELALLYALHGIKQDEAVARARKELERRPQNIDALDAMAYTLLRAGKPTEAGPYMEKALRLGTQSAVMTLHAALIEHGLGNTDKSRTLLRKAWTINPHLSPLLKKQGEAIQKSKSKV